MADDTRTRPQVAGEPGNDTRPDPLVRLDEAADAFDVLRESLAVEEPLDEVLLRLAETAAIATLDADAVTVSVTTSTRPRTAAATDSTLVDIDEEQYRAGRGPCLESARTLKVVRAVVGEHLALWPEFEQAAQQHGICAYLSVPLVLPAQERGQHEHVGTLNIYSRSTSAFDPFDEGLMRLFTTAASAAITNAHRWQRSRDQIEQLEHAMATRAVIEQAKGVLMAVHSCTADEAFAMLVRRSQHENVKLRDVAKNLLDSLS